MYLQGNEYPEIGDKLLVASPWGVLHEGIYVGPQGYDGEDVVHNDKNGGVQLIHLETFAGGRPIEIVPPKVTSWHEREEIVSRALSSLGKPYRLLDFNCEHFANYAHIGRSFSPVVTGLLGMAVVVGVVWAASKA
jgi:hypothetical protein